MTTRATALVAESEELRTKMLEAVNARRLVTMHERLDEPIPANAECVVAALDGSERRRRFEVFANQPVLESVPLIVVLADPLPKWMEGKLPVTAFVSVKRAKSRLVPHVGGVAFYSARGLRYGHFIWHLCVLAGTVCHFFAVLWYAG